MSRKAKKGEMLPPLPPGPKGKGRGVRKSGSSSAEDMPPPPVPRSRKKLRSQEQPSEVSEQGNCFSSEDKTKIEKFVKSCLNECQKLNAHERRKLYVKFRKHYFNHNTQDARDWQKYFAQKLWSWSILFFKAPKSQPVQTALKWIHHVILNLGTPDDMKEAGVEIEAYPLYYYVLKLYLQCHMDERPIVRIRLIEIAQKILEKYIEIEPLLSQNDLKQQLLNECFHERLKDRHQTVRAGAATCMSFFERNHEVIKRLKYFARFDPSMDVRKAALVSLGKLKTERSSFFMDFIFDPDSKVRVEAYNYLSGKPMTSLKVEERSKAIVWGLSQQAATKKVVIEKLLPVWMEQCQNNPIEFLRLLGISKDPFSVYDILNGVYLNDFHETFENIDRSFLDNNNVIPIEKITLESVMFWIFLIKKFGQVRYNQERILPKTDYMIEYLKMVIAAIRAEHVQAMQEDRDEDATLLICLTYFITIVVKSGVEEGNRRNLEMVLKEILLDPVLDEAPLVKMAVDVLTTILSPKLFMETMMEVFQKIFEPDQSTIIEAESRRKLAGSTRTNSVKSITPTSTSNAVRNDDKMELDQESDEDRIPPVAGAPDVAENSEKQKSAKHRPIKEMDKIKMKDKLCNLALQRLRLGEDKGKAVHHNDYLEAHRIQQQIDAICLEESLIKAKMENNSVCSSISTFSKASSAISSNANETSAMEMEQDSEREENLTAIENISNAAEHDETGVTIQDMDQDPLSQATTAGGDARVGISKVNTLKGLVIMNRFLTSPKPKIAPFIRHFYDNFAVNIFTNNCAIYDTRVRAEVLKFICLVGILDVRELRKVLGLIITAIEYDDAPEIRATAFKCIVDIWCKHPVTQFLCTEPELETPLPCVPEVFYSVNATIGQMESMLIILLDNFASDSKKTHVPDAVSIKVSGFIKLLIVGRITSDLVVADILCYWCDNRYQGTKIPYDIGTWVPFFTKMSVSNAQLVGRALLCSVKRIISAQDRKAKDPGLVGANYMNLVDFICPLISNNHLEQPEEEQKVNVEEEVFVAIMDHITNHVKATINPSLGQILSKLNIESEQTAQAVLVEMANALIKLAAMPATATVTALKMALRRAAKRITNRFPDLQEIIANTDKQARRGSSSDDSDSSACLFSDDDVDKENSVPRPRTRASVVSTISQQSNKDSTSSSGGASAKLHTSAVPSAEDIESRFLAMNPYLVIPRPLMDSDNEDSDNDKNDGGKDKESQDEEGSQESQNDEGSQESQDEEKDVEESEEVSESD